jgi:hypothetical protein
LEDAGRSSPEASFRVSDQPTAFKPLELLIADHFIPGGVHHEKEPQFSGPADKLLSYKSPEPPPIPKPAGAAAEGANNRGGAAKPSEEGKKASDGGDSNAIDLTTSVPMETDDSPKDKSQAASSKPGPKTPAGKGSKGKQTTTSVTSVPASAAFTSSYINSVPAYVPPDVDEGADEAAACKAALGKWLNLPLFQGAGVAYDNKTAMDNFKSALKRASTDIAHPLYPLIQRLRTIGTLNEKAVSAISSLSKIVANHLCVFDPQAYAVLYLEYGPQEIIDKLSDPGQLWRTDKLQLYHKLPEPTEKFFGSESTLDVGELHSGTSGSRKGASAKKFTTSAKAATSTGASSKKLANSKSKQVRNQIGRGTAGLGT